MIVNFMRRRKRRAEQSAAQKRLNRRDSVSDSMDVLAIGAHPDDCELFMGATLAKLADLGHQVAIADLTRGECASRGTPETRRREAEAAAAILGVARRITLDLGDTKIGLEPEHRREVVRLLRAERPSLVFTHNADDRNPDHERTCHLVREACFYAYVDGFDTGQQRHRPAALIEFIGNPKGQSPAVSFVVPVNETFARKIEALRAYQSQFYNPEFSGPETWISSKVYLEQIEASARYWGSRIGENYGEPFWIGQLMAVDDPVAFFGRFGAKTG